MLGRTVCGQIGDAAHGRTAADVDHDPRGQRPLRSGDQSFRGASVLAGHSANGLGPHVPRAGDVDRHDLREELVRDELVFGRADPGTVHQAIQSSGNRADEILARHARCDVAVAGEVHLLQPRQVRWQLHADVGDVYRGSPSRERFHGRKANS